MTKTEFEVFEELLLEQLRAESKDCLKTIESNRKLIDNYLNGQDLSYIKKFVNDFNDAVIESKVKKYKLFEQVLSHSLFTKVLEEFRNSEILIRALKEAKRPVVKWLITMDINYYTQDEFGATAFMYAAARPQFDFAVENMLKKKEDFIHIVDNDGLNALFYAIKGSDRVFATVVPGEHLFVSQAKPGNLEALLKSKIDKQHLNNDNENALLYSARYDKIGSYKYLNKLKIYDSKHSNCLGRTTAMYLTEHCRYLELKSYVKDNKLDPNYINKFGEGLVSTYMKNYYKQYTGNIDILDFNSYPNYIFTKNYAQTLRTLVKLNCNFNIPVDEDGNTPIMMFLMMKDYVSAKYILDKCDIIDLSIENKFGVNASYLSLFLTEDVFDNLGYEKTRNAKKLSLKALRKALVTNPTFDNKYNSDDEAINVHQNIPYNNPYPSRPAIAKIVEQWILEILFPEVGGDITTYQKYGTHNVTTYN